MVAAPLTPHTHKIHVNIENIKTYSSQMYTESDKPVFLELFFIFLNKHILTCLHNHSQEFYYSIPYHIYTIQIVKTM